MAHPNRSRVLQYECRYRVKKTPTNCQPILEDLILAAAAVKIPKKLSVIFKTKVWFISYQKHILSMENLLRERSFLNQLVEELLMQRSSQQDSCRLRFKNKTKQLVKDYQAEVECEQLRHGSGTLSKSIPKSHHNGNRKVPSVGKVTCLAKEIYRF